MVDTNTTNKRIRSLTMYSFDDLEKRTREQSFIAHSPNIDSALAKLLAIDSNNFDPVKLVTQSKYKCRTKYDKYYDDQ